MCGCYSMVVGDFVLHVQCGLKDQLLESCNLVAWFDHPKETALTMKDLSLLPGILIFRAVAEPRISTKSAKSREIHQNMRNPAKFARNLTKYMSAQYI